MINNIPVAYAVTYLIGTAALVWFLPTIGPKLMGINLREEGKKLQAAVAGGSDPGPGVLSASRHFDVRAYRVTNSTLANKSVGELESLPKDARVFVLRIRRSGADYRGHSRDGRPGTRRRVIMARQEILVERGNGRPGSRRQRATRFSRSRFWTWCDEQGAGRNQIARRSRRTRVLAASFMRSLMRAGQEIPVAADTRIDRGDVVRLVGTKPIRRARGEGTGLRRSADHGNRHGFRRHGHRARRARRPALGDRRGHAAHAHRQRRRAGHGAGVRLASVGVSVLRSDPGTGDLDLRYRWLVHVHRHRRIDRRTELYFRPEDVRRQSAARRSRVGVDAAHAGDPLRPLRPEDAAVIVLGACAGAGTITAALRAIQDEARSSVPALGYTVPYAIGNIILTAWGPVLVAMMQIGK